jgi:hypothetical protein
VSLSRRAGVPALLAAAAAFAVPALAATPAQAAPQAATLISIDDLTVPDLAPGIPVDARVTVRLSNPVGHPVTVTYRTTDGTATANQDYRPTRRTATIPAGGITTTIPLRVVSDGDAVPAEYFFIDLSDPVGGSIADPRGVVRLHDCTVVCSG